MKSEKNILVAFILNLAFSVFEFIGGIFTNSVAIISDSIHDIGDAASIGVSYFLERKSKRQPDNTYTYGYLRYSVIGSVITVLILFLGSVFVIINAVSRILNPAEINYDGMIVFAAVGVAVNTVAAIVTRKGESLNQRAVNLHMFEDVLGWAVVLIGAVVMRFTDFKLIDPILSICVALYIFIHALIHLKEVLDLFLFKIPEGISVDEITEHLTEIPGVLGVHHVHVWSMDGSRNYATMHVVTDRDHASVKEAVKKELAEHGITHATIEMESEGEICEALACRTDNIAPHHSHGHHHHGHHH